MSSRYQSPFTHYCPPSDVLPTHVPPSMTIEARARARFVAVRAYLPPPVAFESGGSALDTYQNLPKAYKTTQQEKDMHVLSAGILYAKRHVKFAKSRFASAEARVP